MAEVKERVLRSVRREQVTRKLIFVAATLAISAAGLFAFPRDGECFACIWKSTCYSHDICGQCVCVKENTWDVSGYCAVLH